ncbi:hypothetical protein FRC11_010799, partial [Ceratobasidium sp. 423]
WKDQSTQPLPQPLNSQRIVSEFSYSSNESSPPTYFQAYVEKFLERYHSDIVESTPEDDEDRVPFPSEWSKESKLEPLTNTQPVNRIAIIGAGVAGLHAATLLGKHFKVDVYEANKRIGGRLFTHKFESDNPIGTREPGEDYDYFHVGAVRFPDTVVMKKTFELFDELGIPLIPCRMLGEVGVNHGGKFPVEYATQSPSDLLNHEIQPFIKDYLTSKGYPQSMIDYIETMCFGTGGYDRALAETVLEELCFRYNQKNPKDLKWKCIEGGSRFFPVTKSLLFTTDASIEGLPVLNVSGLRSAASGGCASFDKLYSHVIFAVPPPCLRTIGVHWSLVPIVYPSHSDGKSTVLIVSYSWTQDAVALGSLMRGRGTPVDRLKELMLADLAYVHQKDDISIGFLREQFRDIGFYPALHRPAAEGNMHFIGETISTTRGWVAEALESAGRGVYQLLKFHKKATSEEDECHNALKDFKNEWNPVLGVNKTLLKLQLCVSMKLQVEEFHGPKEVL